MSISKPKSISKPTSVSKPTSISRLLYTSEANLRPTDRSTDEQVSQIAQSAAQRNQKSGITGVLIFIDGQFIQVLEGESSAVEAVFEMICCDFNHSNVRLIDFISAPSRLFEGWNMAALSAEGETTIHLRSELEQIQLMVGINARVAVENMRQCLMDEASGPAKSAPTPSNGPVNQDVTATA